MTVAITRPNSATTHTEADRRQSHETPFLECRIGLMSFPLRIASGGRFQ